MATLTVALLTVALLTMAHLTPLQAELLAECPETSLDYRGGAAVDEAAGRPWGCHY